MSDTREKNSGASDPESGPRPPKRRFRRAVLVSLASLIGLLVIAAIGIYAYVSHVASSIPRVHVAHLAGPGTGSGETFLITGSPWQPTGTPVQGVPAIYSKLVMLLHLNASGYTGGVVAIPGDAIVHVPGIGTKPLWSAFKIGGPSLLVQTVSQLTGLPINHYAEIDLNNLTSLVDAIGGVNVTMPAASTSLGHTFSAGINHLTGITAVYYARDPSLTDQERMLREENLLRAILTKIADDHLLTDPVTTVRVLNAITSILTVDSNMTNSEIESLARKLGNLGSGAAIFVTAPTQTVNGQLLPNTAVDDQLWTAIRKDSIANFASTFPATVTPQVVR